MPLVLEPLLPTVQSTIWLAVSNQAITLWPWVRASKSKFMLRVGVDMSRKSDGWALGQLSPMPNKYFLWDRIYLNDSLSDCSCVEICLTQPFLGITWLWSRLREVEELSRTSVCVCVCEWERVRDCVHFDFIMRQLRKHCAVRGKEIASARNMCHTYRQRITCHVPHSWRRGSAIRH